jgi:succinylarginine dihydrolase
MNEYCEVNFDGLVGPSHHYGGLSFGNRASMSHAEESSDPRAAALQGLEKMWSLAQRGYPQAVLPPLPRPNLGLLRALGFSGDAAAMLRDCAEQAPRLLSAAWSASNMWTANAATVIPSLDAGDHRLTFVPANLEQQFHRSQEALATRDVLRSIFSDRALFRVTDPLPGHLQLGDEGAANHTRFFNHPDQPGLHFFVYGDGADEALTYPARQTEQASRAVARLGGLGPQQCVFARQSAEAINAGVFHNDVISVGHGDVLFLHECAFAESNRVLTQLCEGFHAICGSALKLVQVTRSQVPLEDAVSSYLFNSQLLDHPRGGKLLVVPIECTENRAVANYLERLTSRGTSPIREVLVRDLRQSMRNGGGPACLRLRVFLSAQERAALNGRVLLDEDLYTELKAWIEAHYRSRLSFSDLQDPQFYEACHRAFTALAQLLQIPTIQPA